LNIKNVYEVTALFEQALCDYCGSKYAVAVDNCSNAIFLTLMYQNVKGIEITIPNRTYPSLPNEIIHAGAKVNFEKIIGTTLKGAYQLKGTKTIDSALRFSTDIYIPGTFMCLSFSGAHKHLKLGKGGAILCDDEQAYRWFKRARYSGRNECSYHDDEFDMLGWNFYILPEISARALILMQQFYNNDGSKRVMPDIELPFPDLSKFPIYHSRKN
jgi:dTDP-4-amino-4,6-dideoxygalactose transaminase